jgi:DNA-directed RNA polymerase specialized sigma24 family protein
MIEKDTVNQLLINWGKWQRSAKRPSLNYVVSQHDSPLQKKRDVKPIYQDEISENLEQLMLKHLPKRYIRILELIYVEQKIYEVAADILHMSRTTFIKKRDEALAILQGIYSVVFDR